MYVHAKSVESVAALMTLVVTISLVGTTQALIVLENLIIRVILLDTVPYIPHKTIV